MKKKLYLAIVGLFYLFGCSHTDHGNKRSVHYSMADVVWDDDTYPAVVIGGGVAGLTAANYLIQANIPTVVLEGPKPGGALAQSPSVRNWPGILDASGNDIMHNLREQAMHNGVAILQETVVNVRLDVWPFVLEIENIVTSQKRFIKTLSCIIATGAEPNYLDVPGEQKYWGKNVSNCAVCDGGLCKDKDVIVVGGGDSAILEAAYLAGIARLVTLVVRKDYFRANDKKKRDQVLALPNVSVLYNTQITAIDGDAARATHVTLQNNTEITQRSIDNIFLAIGARPNTAMFAQSLKLDAQGYIVLIDGQAASIDGVVAAGDVCDPIFKQAVTSAGGGCAAALQIKLFLENLGFTSVSATKQSVQAQAVIKIPDTGPAVMVLHDNQAIENFLKQQSKPVIIDVFAEWCPPCKRMAPVFEKLAEKYRASIACAKCDVTKINVQELTKLIGGAMVDGVPTLLFVKNGKEIKRLVGGMSADQLENNFKAFER